MSGGPPPPPEHRNEIGVGSWNHETTEFWEQDTELRLILKWESTIHEPLRAGSQPREYKELIPRWVWPAIPMWEEQKESGGIDGRHGLGKLWKERHRGLGKSGFRLVGERRTWDIGTEKHRWLTKSQQASPSQSPHYAYGQCFTKPPLSLNDGFLCRLIYRFCRCLVQEYVTRESS